MVRSKRSRARLFETLESRCMLSVSGILTGVTAPGGNVTVAATAVNDSFTASYLANPNPGADPDLIGTVLALDAGNNVIGTAEVRASEVGGPITGLTIDAGAGNDTVRLTSGLAALSGNITLNGGEGSDQLFGASNSETINGGAGNDRIDGGTGFWDKLNGNEGNDYITDPDGVFSLYGGAGNDVIDVTFANGWTKQSGSTIRRMDGRLQGGAGDDMIRINTTSVGSIFFSLKGDNVSDPTGDGADTFIMLGNYASGSVINFDSSLNANKAATVDRLYASKGGINTGGEPYTAIPSLAAANNAFNTALAAWSL